MPLIYSHKMDNGSRAGVWHNTEGSSFFESQLSLYDEEAVELEQLSPKKKEEWLCSRYLLHELTDENTRMACVKDNYGKPYLIGSDLHISLSHSANYTAAIISKRETGIDIQVRVSKIERIKYKFLSPKEIEAYELHNDLDVLHVYWGVKEALFKAYGKGEVDFRKHLFVEPFDNQAMNCIGHLYKNGYDQKYLLNIVKIQNFILVYIIDKI